MRYQRRLVFTAPALALVASCIDISDNGVNVFLPLPESLAYAMVSKLPEEGAPLAVAGPYEVVAEPAFDAPDLLVYRPAALDAFPNNDTLPIVAWGNGGCVADGEAYAPFLTTLASYGFLVVTSAPTGRRMRVGEVSAANLLAGVDWAEAEAARETSPLFGKITTDSVAVMGQSCGGLLAIAAASDPRIDTIGAWNAGVGSSRQRWANQAAVAAIRTPVLYVDGHDKDQMTPYARADFEAISVVPIFLGERIGGGHFGTMLHEGGGEFANVGAAWLIWRLKGDEASGAMFAGEECGLCTDPNWVVKRKGWE
jgi:hypothetical protein